MTFLFLSLALMMSPQNTVLEVEGLNIVTETPYQQSEKDFRVLVFVSQDCPCSLSHEAHLNELAREFSDQVEFVAIQAPVVTFDSAKKHYSNYSMPALIDKDFELITKLKAYRTPHAYVFDQNKKLLYQGAVSSSTLFSPENKLYLKTALAALVNHQAIKTERTKPLGCPIPRN